MDGRVGAVGRGHVEEHFWGAVAFAGAGGVVRGRAFAGGHGHRQRRRVVVLFARQAGGGRQEMVAGHGERHFRAVYISVGLLFSAWGIMHDATQRDVPRVTQASASVGSVGLMVRALSPLGAAAAGG